MTEQPSETVVDRFPPTNGRFSGFLGLGVAALILAFAVAAWDPNRPLGVAILAAIGGVLSWVALLRPALWATSSDLHMRGMLHTDVVPLAAIDKVVVTQVLTVSAGERRLRSPTVGYTARQTMKAKVKRGSQRVGTEVDTHQLFVESRIAHLGETDRERRRITQGSPEQQALVAAVRRTYAWPEIVALSLLAVGFVVWLALP